LDLNELLRYTVEQRGSDLHVKAGSPPHVRVDGTLPTADQVAQVRSRSA
jgi:Tfp pilus assembly pilus retraction ATPase PilT